MVRHLLLLAALACAQRERSATTGGGVLISSLVYEGSEYVARTLENLVQFTRPETPIVVHFSASIRELQYRLAVRDAPARVRVNPARLLTHHGGGGVLLGHLSNAHHAAVALGLNFSHVLLASSTSRFFRRGVEAYVLRRDYVDVDEPTWLAKYCLSRRRPLHRFFFDALMEGDKARCRAGFSQHEGAFFPRRVLERFERWARRRPENGTTLLDRVARLTGASGGQGPEEVYLQSFVLARDAEDYAAAPRGPPVCEHHPPRTRTVGAADAAAFRLGRNFSSGRAPFMIKRWGADGDDFLACLARGADGDAEALQRATVACVDEVGLDLPTTFDGARPGRSPLLDFFGGEDPLPDLRAVGAAVRAWVRHSNEPVA